jgi:hypothetical protein
VRKYSDTIIEAALLARDCLFFVPTVACITIVGAAVFLSAESMLVDDHTKAARLLANSGLKETPHRADAWKVLGLEATALPRLKLKAQRIDECHSGPCMYGLHLSYPDLDIGYLNRGEHPR